MKKVVLIEIAAMCNDPRMIIPVPIEFESEQHQWHADELDWDRKQYLAEIALAAPSPVGWPCACVDTTPNVIPSENFVRSYRKKRIELVSKVRERWR